MAGSVLQKYLSQQIYIQKRQKGAFWKVCLLSSTQTSNLETQLPTKIQLGLPETAKLQFLDLQKYRPYDNQLLLLCHAEVADRLLTRDFIQKYKKSRYSCNLNQQSQSARKIQQCRLLVCRLPQTAGNKAFISQNAYSDTHCGV